MLSRLSRCTRVVLSLCLCVALSACSGKDAGHTERIPTGTLDSVDSKAIQGWAWDPERPDTPIEVELYDGKSLLGKITADKFRKDLVKNGKGNGSHGFTFPTPASLKDGRRHSIRATISGTEIDLIKSPQNVTLR